MLALDHQPFFDDMYQSLLRELGSLGHLKRVKNPETALRLLSSEQLPTVVLLTDAGLSQPRHAAVWEAVVKYIREGGTAIAMGLFSGFIKPADFKPFFSKAGLAWDMTDYHRTDVSLNPSAHDYSTFTKGMARTYSQKAVFAGNVLLGDAWYITTENSRVQSAVFPSDDTHRVGKSPVAFARVGEGRFGYLGDVNAEPESDTAIIAMCRLAF